MDSNIIQLAARKPPLRYRDYCPVAFFVQNEITYGEFQRALEAGGMRIVPDPQYPGSHVVMRCSTGGVT